MIAAIRALGPVTSVSLDDLAGLAMLVLVSVVSKFILVAKD